MILITSDTHICGRKVRDQRAGNAVLMGITILVRRDAPKGTPHCVSGCVCVCTRAVGERMADSAKYWRRTPAQVPNVKVWPAQTMWFKHSVVNWQLRPRMPSLWQMWRRR